MTKENKILMCVENKVPDYAKNFTKAKKALMWTIEHSELSVSRVLDSISFEEIRKGDETDLSDTLYIKVSRGFSSGYINYLVVPKSILKKRVQKRLFPKRLVMLDVNHIIIK